MPVDCRSPYKFARINYDGAVRLCQKFTVGSIYDADLLTIWQGEAAKSLRAEVREDGDVCHSCEYFKFCIRAGQVDYADPSVFSSADLVEHLEQHPRFSVIRYGRAFFMCPSPGEVSAADLSSKTRRRGLRIERTETIEEARRLGEVYTERRMFRLIDIIERHPHFNIIRYDGRLYMCPGPNNVHARDLTNHLRRGKLGIRPAEGIVDARRLGRASATARRSGGVDDGREHLAQDGLVRRVRRRVAAAVRRRLQG